MLFKTALCWSFCHCYFPLLTAKNYSVSWTFRRAVRCDGEGRLCGAERFDTISTPSPYPGLFVKRVLPCLSVFTHTFPLEALAFDISPCPPLPTFQSQPWSFLITSVWVGKNGWFNTGLTRILNKKVNQTSTRLMNIFF